MMLSDGRSTRPPPSNSERGNPMNTTATDLVATKIADAALTVLARKEQEN